MKEFLINYAIGTLLTVLKDTAAHMPLKNAMLKVFTVIAQVYRHDEDFVSAARQLFGLK